MSLQASGYGHIETRPLLSPRGGLSAGNVFEHDTTLLSRSVNGVHVGEENR